MRNREIINPRDCFIHPSWQLVCEQKICFCINMQIEGNDRQNSDAQQGNVQKLTKEVIFFHHKIILSTHYLQCRTYLVAKIISISLCKRSPSANPTHQILNRKSPARFPMKNCSPGSGILFLF